MKGTAWWFSICLIFVAAAILGGCGTSAVTLTFPDFPGGVAVIDLGESLTINVTAANDGGMGVTWKCAGEACAPPARLISTATSVTFAAKGITGLATITATSIKQPTITKSIRVTVNLNDVPVLCGSR